MKSLMFLILSTLLLSSCWGYHSRDSVLTGQVKKVVHQTPLFCDERIDVDVSLGVMRNGVGSMSHEDLVLTVPNEADAKILDQAAKTGQIVDITYDVKRVTWCWQGHIVRSVTLSK